VEYQHLSHPLSPALYPRAGPAGIISTIFKLNPHCLNPPSCGFIFNIIISMIIASVNTFLKIFYQFFIKFSPKCFTGIDGSRRAEFN